MGLFIRVIGSIRGQILIVTAGLDYCWMGEKRRKKAKNVLEALAKALRRKGKRKSSLFFVCVLCVLLRLMI